MRSRIQYPYTNEKLQNTEGNIFKIAEARGKYVLLFEGKAYGNLSTHKLKQQIFALLLSYQVDFINELQISNVGNMQKVDLLPKLGHIPGGLSWREMRVSRIGAKIHCPQENATIWSFGFWSDGTYHLSATGNDYYHMQLNFKISVETAIAQILGI